MKAPDSVAAVIKDNVSELWRRFSGGLQPDMSAAAAPPTPHVR